MTRYLKLICAVLVLPLTGCNLGYLQHVYNLTSCPIRVGVSDPGRIVKGGGTVPVLPGSATVAVVQERGLRLEQIIVIDINNVEHRYDKDALAALRPSGSRDEDWGYTGEGLIFVNVDPKARDLDALAKQPCVGSGQAQPVQKSTNGAAAATS